MADPSPGEPVAGLSNPSSLARILGSRKGAYVATVVVLSVPIVATLTYLAATGRVSWDLAFDKMQWIFGVVTTAIIAAVLGTSIEDSASKGAGSSVQVQGDNAVVNVPSIRPPPFPLPGDAPLPTLESTSAARPWSETGDPQPQLMKITKKDEST